MARPLSARQAVKTAKPESEARKFRLGMVLAHQYTSQLVHMGSTQILDAILGNVGTCIAFRVGLKDAILLEGMMAPWVRTQDVADLPDFTAFVRSVGALGNQPFTMQTRPAPPAARSSVAALRRKLARRSGRPRAMVEAQIAAALESFPKITDEPLPESTDDPNRPCDMIGPGRGALRSPGSLAGISRILRASSDED